MGWFWPTAYQFLFWVSKKKIHEEIRVTGRKNGKMIKVASVNKMCAFF